MKYLGIDFGTKNIGLAISDEDGRIAFPFRVIPRTRAEEEILKVCQQESIDEIVSGDTLQGNKEENPVTAELSLFIEKLEELTGKKINLQNESFTTGIFILEKLGKQMNTTRGGRPEKLGISHEDDRVASVILQRYLDKINGIK
jgi:putative Holliday junction resolvase